jgi:hypothetical protein
MRVSIDWQLRIQEKSYRRPPLPEKLAQWADAFGAPCGSFASHFVELRAGHETNMRKGVDGREEYLKQPQNAREWQNGDEPVLRPFRRTYADAIERGAHLGLMRYREVYPSAEV